jgi:hypothetical protein
VRPFVVLGTYEPKRWRAHLIGEHLTAFTASLGLVPLDDSMIQRNARPIWQDDDLHAEVRRSAVRDSQGTSWHQDGDTSTKDLDFALVLWSERDCTEFRAKSGKVYIPQPFDIVIARNLGCLHRRNPLTEGKRWSFRQRVELPTTMTLP